MFIFAAPNFKKDAGHTILLSSIDASAHVQSFISICQRVQSGKKKHVKLYTYVINILHVYIQSFFFSLGVVLGFVVVWFTPLPPFF